MAFKKILVPLTGADSDRTALVCAFAAAAPFDGHVQALFVFPDPQSSVPFTGMPVSPEVVQQIIDSADSIAREGRAHARANLDAAAREANVAVLDAPAIGRGVTCSFREVEGGFTAGVRDAARLSDLVVFGPSAAQGGPDIGGAFIETLTHGGRPVLLAPQEAVEDLVPKIVVGWDASAVAAHAISAAMPLLACAGTVELFMVGERANGTVSPDDALEYLSLHGIEARPRIFDAGHASPGEVLLREADAAGATLLVLGGYGHSRLFETLFGGTTVHAAAHSTLPLFMVH